MQKIAGKLQPLEIIDCTHTLNAEGLRTNIPEYLVIHSTRSYPEFQHLYDHHKSRGFSGVGYHYFISDSNRIHQARPNNLEGAHAIGFNTNSIGISFYAPEGKLDAQKIAMGQKLIDNLRVEFGNLPIISHTFAQVEYINRILKQGNYGLQFQADQDIVLNSNFNKLKSEIDKFTGHLSTEQNEKLKKQLKSFKNCPGELFKNFS